MIEKRFTIEYVQGNPTIFHIVDNGKHIDEMKICELLNTQHERIEDYNVALKTLQDLTDKKTKENEQLKQEIQELKGDVE